MSWKVTIIYPTRPIIGNALQMAEALSITMEQITPDAQEILQPPQRRMIPASRSSSREDDGGRFFAPVQQQQRLTYPKRDQTPSGSFPTFQKPEPDGVTTRDEIEDADTEGYAAFLECGMSPAEAMSPYPQGSTLERAWKNGYARAEHSDIHADDDGM